MGTAINYLTDTESKTIRTLSASTFSIGRKPSVAGKEDPKNGLEFFNHDLAMEIASLTSSREGRITCMSSEVLKYQNMVIISFEE